MYDYNSPEYMAKVLDSYGLDFTQHKVMCPFHGDINPSMSVDLAKSRVYCFGCQKSYTALQFVEAAEPNLNRLQVYSRMAEIAKGKKIDLKPQHIRDNSNYDFAKLLTQAKDYYYNLPKMDWVYDYKNHKRQDKPELYYLLDRGFSPRLLNVCGAKVNFNEWYPIIFPIMDNGSFKGWLCRTTRKDVEAKRKYLYNKGFRRSTCLCGKYNNKSPLVLVEGYTDMLKLRQAGLKNVVATLGWKMSKEQRQLLSEKNITHVVSAFDNDDAGRQGDIYIRTLGFSKVDKWIFGKKHKDPGDQTSKDIKKIANILNLSIDKDFIL